ncbi:MAG: 50S ribosomal protein L25, partial [Dorea sp.]|nr:50S ribosomal protein L25 [Dorea sp.]
MNTLKAERRSMDVKAKKLRREGFVTGNVFGREMKESIPVKMEKQAVDRLLKTSNKGSQIILDIDGEEYDVLIKDIEFNPLKGQVDEIDFQALVSNEKVHSVAEVVLINH